MDAPQHLLPDAPGMETMMLSRCFAPGVLLDARARREIQPPIMPKGSLCGRAVLLYTGMDKAYGTESYYRDHPYVSVEMANWLAMEKIAFLGMDIPSPDYPPFPVHKLLLAAGIPIVENLRGLDALTHPFDVAAFPLRIEAEASPVRAVARLSHDKSGPAWYTC